MSHRVMLCLFALVPWGVAAQANTAERGTVGRIVIAPGLYAASDFSEGLAFVHATSVLDAKGRRRPVLAGFVDKEGRVVIAPQFYRARAFAQGLAAVSTGEREKFGYIDKEGKWKIPPQFSTAGDFGQGRAYVRFADGSQGYIDERGERAIDLAGATEGAQLSAAGRFANGRAPIALLRVSYIDIKTLKPAKPSQVAMDSATTTRVVADEPVWGFIDTTGKLAIGAAFSHAGEFSDGLAVVQTSNQLYGYIDTLGTMVLSPRFLYADRFSEGLAPVAVEEGFGFIDRQGRMVIAPRFKDARPFGEGLAPVQVSSGRWGYIDRSGKLVVAAQFDAAWSFSDGRALIRRPYAPASDPSFGTTPHFNRYGFIGR